MPRSLKPKNVSRRQFVFGGTALAGLVVAGCSKDNIDSALPDTALSNSSDAASSTTKPTTSTTSKPTTTLPPGPPHGALSARHNTDYPDSAPLLYRDQSDIVIENLTFLPQAGQISIHAIAAANITIRNCWFIGDGDTTAIKLDTGCQNILVENCSFRDVTKCVLAHQTVGNIVVRLNDAVGIGTGASAELSNFTQFDKASGAGNLVELNSVDTPVGGSTAEDLVSVFASHGEPDSPITIRRNRLRGGGPSNRGSGVMTGDGTGSHQLVEANILVDTGQNGIGIASGTDIVVRDNIVFSDSYPWSGVPGYTRQYYDGECGRWTVSGNRSNFSNLDEGIVPWSNSGVCSPVTIEGNDWFDTTLDTSIWDTWTTYEA